jgi:DNA-directed RNA polymerase subunit K/omega
MSDFANIRYLSKFCFVQCITTRAKEIELYGSNKIDEKCLETDPIKIAIWELKNRKFPYLIKLFTGFGDEYITIDPSNCVLPDF